MRQAAASPSRAALRWADTCLIHAQRLSEWCGQGPVLEEDIALTNMALRRWYTSAFYAALPGGAALRGVGQPVSFASW